MFKNKQSTFILLMIIMNASFVYGQAENVKQQVRTVSGIIAGIDPVGSVINIQTTDTGTYMTFFVPEQAKKMRNAQDIGLLDIKQGHPVTIQYSTPTSGTNNVISIVDNKPGID